jgi:hypothetical protein
VKLFQILVKLKYKLQDDQKIKINVDKELGLLPLLDQKKKYLNFDLLIIL